MIKTFGTEEYGEQENFSVTCKNCGRESDVIPTHHYDSDLKLPQKITLEFRCMCGKKFGATIHHSS